MSDVENHTALDTCSMQMTMQLYTAVKPRHDNQVGLALLESCINNIKDWMQVNFLKLNDSKSEFIMFGSEHNLSHSKNCIKVGNHQIATVETVLNLGALMDKHLSIGQLYSSKIKEHHLRVSSLELLGESGSFLHTVHVKY